MSQHLRVLRESGFTTVRPDGARRLYAVDSAPLQEVDMWLAPFRHFWNRTSTHSQPNSPAASASAASIRTEERR